MGQNFTARPIVNENLTTGTAQQIVAIIGQIFMARFRSDVSIDTR